MNKSYYYLLFISIFLIIISFNTYRIYSDGVGYFVILETLFKDFNINFDEQKKYLELAPQALAGYSFGYSIICFPLYLFSFLLSKILPIFLRNIPYSIDLNIQTISVITTSNIMALVSILFSIKMIEAYRRETESKKREASNKKRKTSFLLLFSIFCLFLGSPLFVYSSHKYASFAHSINAGISSIIFYLLIKKWNNHNKIDVLWIGLLTGIFLSIRYTNAIFLLPMEIYFLSIGFRYFLIFNLGVASFAWTIPVYIYYLPKEAYYFNSHLLRLQEFSQIFSPRFLQILFSKSFNNKSVSLFVDYPLILLSIIGLNTRTLWNKKSLALFLNGVVFLYIYIYGFHGEVIVSGDYARYFTCLFPIFAFGLSLFIRNYNKYASFVIISLLSFYSFASFFNPKFFNSLPIKDSKLWTTTDVNSIISLFVDIKNIIVKNYMNPIWQTSAIIELIMIASLLILVFLLYIIKLKFSSLGKTTGENL